MASNLPIPEPPRTPTPPTPIRDDPTEGLGIYGGPRLVNSTVSFDPNSLSPLTDTFPHRFGSMTSPMPSPANTISTETSNGTPNSDGSAGAPARNPFNFQTQTYTMAPVAKSVSQLLAQAALQPSCECPMTSRLTSAEYRATARP